MKAACVLTVVLLVPGSSTAWAQSSRPAANDVTIDYDQHVKPILAAKCFGCHGPKQQQSGLRLDRRQPALRGGDYGPVITPGNSAESKLIQRITGSEATRSTVKPAIGLNARSVASGGATLSPCTQLVSLSPPTST